MQIHNGTPQVTEFFNRLKNEGILVDLYSKEFFHRNKTSYQDGGFLLEEFENIIDIENGKNDEYIEKYPIGHLLLMCLSLMKNEDKKLLVDLYPPISNVLKDHKHHPNFLVLNLYTKQVLAVGLGRKNRLFCIDVLTNKSIDTYNPSNKSADYSYLEKFQEHDVLDFLFEDLIWPLQNVSSSLHDSDHLPALEILYEALENGSNEDGQYDVDGFDEKISFEELSNIIEEKEGYEAELERSVKILQCFFPSLDLGDLDTGDY